MAFAFFSVNVTVMHSEFNLNPNMINSLDGTSTDLDSLMINPKFCKRDLVACTFSWHSVMDCLAKKYRQCKWHMSARLGVGGRVQVLAIL